MKHPDKPFIVVTWDDAHGSAEDVSEHMIDHKPMRAQSYGWLLRSDETGITLAAEWTPADALWRDTTFIPRKMVAEEVVLSLFKKRAKKVLQLAGEVPDVRS